MSTYVEQDCTFEHEGRQFESGGAEITPTYAIGYVCARSQSDKTLVLKNWHGDRELGRAQT